MQREAESDRPSYDDVTEISTSLSTEAAVMARDRGERVLVAALKAESTRICYRR